MVLLRLQPYRQVSMANRRHQKLLPKYYGPFKIIQRVGTMAYKLDLPTDARIHPVFHVSALKAYIAGFSTDRPSLPLIEPVSAMPQPQAVLGHRTRAGKSEVLIHWQHSSPADASWETKADLSQRFPD